MTDVNDRMIDVIDRFTPDGDRVHAVVAEKVVAWLGEHDPALLTEWLDTNAAAILTAYVGDRDRALRRTPAGRARARAFAEAARSPDPAALDVFRAVTFEIDDDHTRRPLGDMVAADCRYVAAAYSRNSVNAAMKAALWTAVADRLGLDRVADVLTIDEATALLGRQ